MTSGFFWGGNKKQNRFVSGHFPLGGKIWGIIEVIHGNVPLFTVQIGLSLILFCFEKPDLIRTY